MADPHIESQWMFGINSPSLFIAQALWIAAFSILALTGIPQQAQIAVLIAATCCASSLHIYLKTFPLNIPICHVACTLMCAFRLA